ncbi:hypothetical protein GCM10027586_00080 [Kineococcus gypseus]|uniref:hypothetical protein n=1 Tax=Kineococcus gypseus TaxID=1637102 RepID=UPI003D7ECC6A
MLTSSPSPERVLYAVEVGERDWLGAARVCVAVLEVLRPSAGALVLDVHTDRWSEQPAGAHGPAAVLPFSLLEQQDWAEQELRELDAAGHLAHRTGRWPGAVVVDPGVEEHWRLARTLATAALGVQVRDRGDRLLAELQDAGTVVTAALTGEEVEQLRRRVPRAAVRALSQDVRDRLQRALDAQARLRERGRAQQRAERAKQEWAEQAGRRSPRPRIEVEAAPAHPADDYAVSAEVRTQVLPGRPPARVVLRLSTGRFERPREHDELAHVHEGVFAVSLYAISSGVFPDGEQLLACRVLSASRWLIGERATLVADVPGGELLVGTGRPPLSDGWGLWMPWDGWSVWVERAGEETFAFETPVSWSTGSGVVSAAGSAVGGGQEPDGIARVTLRLHRR